MGQDNMKIKQRYVYGNENRLSSILLAGFKTSFTSHSYFYNFFCLFVCLIKSRGLYETVAVADLLHFHFLKFRLQCLRKLKCEKSRLN